MNDLPSDIHKNAVKGEDKLSFWLKLAYGAGDLGPAITANISSFYLLIFFTNVAGISPALAGSILMVGKIWDAINDPIMGVLTDRTESQRWGRRLPWLLYGAVPFGITFVLQWIVPQFSSNRAINIWGLFAYYVVIGLISQVFYTIVNLPYTAMTPELTQNYDERTSLNSFRFAFSIGGSMFSLILAQIIFNRVKEPQSQYLILAGLCGVIATVGLLSCVFGVRDRILAFEVKRTQKSFGKPAETPLIEQFKIAFSNRPFLFVIGIYLFSWLALQITASILPYYIVNCMGLQDGDVPMVLIRVQGTALLMLFLWSYLSKKVGKKIVYFLGTLLWIIAAGGLYIIRPEQTNIMYILAVIAGAGVSTAYLIPWSMMPDIIELDELQTQQRREGVFYGFMVLLQKFGLAFGLFLVGLVLEASGFKEKIPGVPGLPEQPESALAAIRTVVGPIPIILLIAGVVLTYFYPITREMHAEIMMKLQQRNEVELEE